ncbi:MAG TPA: SH3 domain-containing protein, partial [Bacteroidales bacterium]|nr:SH3 domain-containing protein [Bacteroidales bacterium]
FWLIVFSTIFFIYFFSSFIYQNIKINNSKNAIVTAQSTNLYSSPDSLSIAIAVINEGTEVKCIESIGNWQKILTPNQKTGWLQNDNLLLLKYHLPPNK